MSSPLLIPVGYQFLSNSGAPLAGGSLTTYAAGTASPLATFSDDGLSVQNPNPIPLNAAGRCASGTGSGAVEVNVYPQGASYKLVLQDASGTTIWTHDNIDPAAPWNLGAAFPLGVTGGVSGAIPYFSSTTVEAVSALLTNHALIIGGGTGNPPKTVAALLTGQVLYGVTGADPTPGQPALTISSVAAPTGTTSTTAVMMGLAATITPVVTGRVIFVVVGNVWNNTLNDTVQYVLSYGTGTAPANGAALTGTTTGAKQQVTGVASGAYQLGFALVGLATGLTLATAYWFDVQLNVTVGGTGQINNVTSIALEV